MHPPLVIDTLGNELGLDPEQSVVLMSRKKNLPYPPLIGVLAVLLVAKDTSNSSAAESHVSTAGTSEPQSEERAVSSGKKRKKRTKAEQAEIVMHDLVDKVLESSRASELKMKKNG